MCISLDSSLEVFCARCTNSAVSESWSGFLPKRHAKWPFLATVSLATLHLHLSLLSHKVMHYSMPKWPLFDHLTNLTLKWPVFIYVQMLIASYPLMVARMVALFSVHALLIVSHTIPVHSQFIRLTDPMLCTVCMHMQCFLCTKMLKMDSILAMVMLHYSYAHSNYCKKETNLKTQTRQAKTAWKWKWAGGTQPPK